MAITYNTNIPQPTDEPSTSQPQLLENFNGINTIWDVNHYQFASDDAGKHKFCSLVSQGGAPPAAAAGEFQLTTAAYATTTNDELFIARSSDNGQLPSALIPFTAMSDANPGWSYLPSGLLMKWGISGSIAVGGIGSNTFNYPVAADIPVFTAAAIHIQLQEYPVHIGAGVSPDYSVYLSSLGNTTSFDYRAQQRTTTGAPAQNVQFLWIAIGKGV